MKVHPQEVELKAQERVLNIRWSDGQSTRFSLRYLRGWCPCAACQGHFNAQKTFVEVEDPQLVNVEPVGSYAMRLYWSDGHQSGIFAFDYLLELAAGPPSEGPTNEELLGLH